MSERGIIDESRDIISRVFELSLMDRIYLLMKIL
jgi:hypothetical protein